MNKTKNNEKNSKQVHTFDSATGKCTCGAKVRAVQGFVDDDAFQMGEHQVFVCTESWEVLK